MTFLIISLLLLLFGFVQVLPFTILSPSSSSSLSLKHFRKLNYHHYNPFSTSINHHNNNSNDNDDNVLTIRKNIELLPLRQVTKRLHEIINNNNDNDKNNEDIIIATEGYITHRRIFGSSLAFIDLVNNNNNNNDNKNDNSECNSKEEEKQEITILQALLKRQEYKTIHSSRSTSSSSLSSFKSIIKSLYPGTKVYIQGKASTTQNPGEVVLLVNYIKFIGLSHNPEHVKGLLQRIKFYKDDDNENLLFVDNTTKGMEEIQEQQEDVVEGLVMTDVIDAFGGIVNETSLALALMGNIHDLNSILLSTTATTTKNTTMPNNNFVNNNDYYDTNVQQWNSKRVAYAKIARLIIDSLPYDPYYPTDILASKGYSKGTKKDKKYKIETGKQGDNSNGTSWQYPTLPKAQGDITNVPLKLQNLLDDMRDKGEDFDFNTFTSVSISDLLDKNEQQQQQQQQEGEELDLFTISGYIQNRRRFQGENGSITVLEVVDEENNAETSDDENLKRLKCVLHPACCLLPTYVGYDNSFIPSNTYGHLFAKGSRVNLKGYFNNQPNTDTHEISGRSSFWVTEARISRLSWRPNVITFFLDCLKDHTDKLSDEEIQNNYNLPFNLFEIADAVALPNGIDGSLELLKFCRDQSATKRQWQAAEISKRLQDDKSRMGRVSDEMNNVLDTYSALREQFPLEYDEYIGDFDNATILGFSRDTLGDITFSPTPSQKGNSDKFLRMSLDGSRWQRAKRPQLKWMTNQIAQVVQSHPDFKKRPLNILDIGGGRGHLANYLASSLGENFVNVHVIDIDSRTVRNGKFEAEQRSLNVQYNVGDASKMLLQEGHNQMQYSADVVVALHACGVLSDIALAHAIVNNAALVITPCCFRSNPHLRITMKKTNEAGQSYFESISQSEWLDIDENELDKIKYAAEIQGDVETAGKGIHSLCALRAKALLNHHSLVDEMDIKLKQFPISLSTRNYCIIGSFK